jgi:hypothetical protein
MQPIYFYCLKPLMISTQRRMKFMSTSPSQEPRLHKNLPVALSSNGWNT